MKAQHVAAAVALALVAVVTAVAPTKKNQQSKEKYYE